MTFYRNEALSELPDFTDYSMRDRTYKYYTGTPLYPFGYGLSYADMALRELSADRTEARVTVENRSGFTVVGEDGVRRGGSGSWTLWAGFGQPDARTEELNGQKCLSVTIREG